VGVLDGLVPPAAVTYYLVAKLGTKDFVYPAQNPACPDTSWPCFRQTIHFGTIDESQLYFSDFEANDGGLVPSTTHSDGKSDFEWGSPSGMSGDPTTAKSGTKIWGTDLGITGDGLYSHGRTSYLDLPPLDARKFKQVRLLFWRYLLNADTAKILVNDHPVYTQRWTTFFWRDPVWTFQSIDISPQAAGQENVQIRFVMKDEFVDGFEFGGWNIDDVQILGLTAAPGQPPVDPQNPDLPAPSLTSCASASPGSYLALVTVCVGVWARQRRRKGAGQSR
jgi:hypothetical protein